MHEIRNIFDLIGTYDYLTRKRSLRSTRERVNISQQIISNIGPKTRNNLPYNIRNIIKTHTFKIHL